MVSGACAPGPRIIVALDFAQPAEALKLAERLNPDQCRVKVGKELFTRAGPDIVRRLGDLGFAVFLDLKFHDIPNTVAGACRSAADLGVWMLNVHATGGRRMLEAARRSLEDSQPRPLLIAVTILTSLAEEELGEAMLRGPVAASVARLASLAEEVRLDGVVCSARELEGLAAEVAPSFLRVTPGIRPAWAKTGDQRRIVTPAKAIALGSHYLVIGRPITEAADPAAALARIEAEIAAVIEA